MSNPIWKRLLQEIAFSYLIKYKRCSTHKIVHTGRYAYALSLGVSLGKSKESLDQICSYLLSQLNDVGKFPRIFPGNLKRRNYSTDAIDIGICVDAISLFWSKYPPTPSEFKKISTLVDVTLCRLASKSEIPNQRLWAAVGLAHFAILTEVEQEKSIKYRSVCAEAVQTFLSSIAKDGFTPYFTRNASLNSHSPYYHSRCIAFSLRIFDLLEFEFNDFDLTKIASAVDYMIRVHNQNGTKNPLLDSKRYYFLESQENYSQVFELFVLHHPVVQKLNRAGVQDLAIKTERNFEALTKELSRTMIENMGKRLLSWQCHYMGMSYLAWLSYLTEPLIQVNSEFQISAIEPLESDSGIYRLSCAPNSALHLVAQKSPLGFATGGFTSGLVFSEGGNGSFAIAGKLPLHFSQYDFTFNSFRNLFLKFRQDLPIIKLMLVEMVIERRSLKFLFILTKQIILYAQKNFQISTRFVTRLDVKISGTRSLSHPLYLSDISGNPKIYIGKREIKVEPGQILISDYLIASHKFKDVELSIPQAYSSTMFYFKNNDLEITGY